jgi:hypothetical protein
VVLVSAPVDQLPLVATGPLHPPDAVHAVAFEDVQVSVDMPPAAIVVGEAVRVTVGAVAVTTISVDCVVLPLGPVQVSVYTVVVVKGSVVIDPVTGCVPVQPPDAVQVWALAEVHCRVVVLPTSTVVLAAVKVSVGMEAVPEPLPPVA